jgi:hypothetical protein
MMASRHIPEKLDRQARVRFSLRRLQGRFAQTKAAILTGLFLAAGLAGFGSAISAQAATDPASRSFDFSYVINIVPPKSTQKMRVWVPLPSSDQFQTITQMQVKAPAGMRMHKDSKYGDRYAYVSVDPSQIEGPFEIRVAFHVVRYERRLDSVSVTNQSQPFPKDVIPYLQADKRTPLDGVIASLANEQTQGLTDPLQKARKIYDYVTSTMRYEPDAIGGGRGDAVWAADSHDGNCVDFHSLFVGMARAAGVPARFEIGFSVPEEQKEGTILSYHSWAEFYVNGIGWIPVDAFNGWQEPDKRDYFFGSIDAQRVMFSIGRDVPLTPAPKVGPLNYIVYPYVEADGQPFANYSTNVFFHEAGAVSATPSKKLIFADRGFIGSRLLTHFPS